MNRNNRIKKIENKPKRRKAALNSSNDKDKIIRFIILILTSTFIFSIFKLCIWMHDNYKSSKLKEELTQYTKPSNNDKSKEEDNIDVSDFSIDFDSLEKINTDIVGWIIINNTNINYPIVQAKNNSYYLNRDFKKKPNGAGAIFLDYKNDINNLSKNNVIYGHNRLNNTMFSSLKNILNKSWYENEDNRKLYIYTPDSTLEWEICSIYKIKSEDYYITTVFNNDTFNQFIKTISKRSIYSFNTSLNINDKILTLSTCYGYNDSHRLVLHAKLLE
ncbi:MAG: class B sortase [Clostridia bacterium]|nr:class B sortase [Clostridia bacterium]MDD4376438.1 class B sortase [Clostridia bacterium]